jgi:aspartokinase-like uncharacterized kinase
MIVIRVIKLGGSLLDWPEWPTQFRRWLARQPEARNILIAGGGALADEVRRRDSVVGLDPSTAHWLAIGAMSTNIAAVRRLLPEAMCADRWEDIQPSNESGSLIAFCPRDFLRRIEPSAPGSRLPHSWDVTSDSIAARLAAVLGAQELVLLKSASPPPEVTSLWQLAQVGYVDPCFPRFASGIAAVRSYNLRESIHCGVLS